MSAYLQLDWLAFTFKPSTASSLSIIEQFAEAFPEFSKVLSEAEACSVKSHYDITLSWFDDIIICYNEIKPDEEASCRSVSIRYNQGVNVQVPSHSLELLFNLMGLSIGDCLAIPKLLSILKKRNCNLSRIDLAFDDYTKKYTTFDYIKFWVEGRIQSPFIRSITTMGDKAHGYTMYVGSLKKRDKLLRIYDKFLESDGVIDAVRYEFELHGDKARAIFEMLLNEYQGGIDFPRFLCSWIKVKKPNNCSNISCVKNDVDWFLWLASFDDETFARCKESLAQNLNLTLSYIVPIRIPKLEKLENPDVDFYLINQALPSITGAVQLHGWEWLHDNVAKARKSGRVNKKYQRYINKLKSSDEFIHLKNVNNPFFIDKPFVNN